MNVTLDRNFWLHIFNSIFWFSILYLLCSHIVFIFDTYDQIKRTLNRPKWRLSLIIIKWGVWTENSQWHHSFTWIALSAQHEFIKCSLYAVHKRIVLILCDILNYLNMNFFKVEAFILTSTEPIFVYLLWLLCHIENTKLIKKSFLLVYW